MKRGAAMPNPSADSQGARGGFSTRNAVVIGIAAVAAIAVVAFVFLAPRLFPSPMEKIPPGIYSLWFDPHDYGYSFEMSDNGTVTLDSLHHDYEHGIISDSYSLVGMATPVGMIEGSTVFDVENLNVQNLGASWNWEPEYVQLILPNNFASGDPTGFWCWLYGDYDQEGVYAEWAMVDDNGIAYLYAGDVDAGKFPEAEGDWVDYLESMTDSSEHGAIQYRYRGQSDGTYMIVDDEGDVFATIGLALDTSVANPYA